jgi:hypothetical protein
VESASLGAVQPAGTPRFVRFPGFRGTRSLINYAKDNDITIISADLSPADWKNDEAEVTMQRVRHLLDDRDNGIIVLHCNQSHTVELLPMVIEELKMRHMKVVQIVPG